MSYLLYKGGTGNNNGTTITNYGNGGAAYNGQATRNQQNQYSWGPLNANNDGIIVPGGISSPNQHSWQMHLVINQWWPVAGIVNGLLCGNDGKLWSIGANTAYGYIHGETNNGAPTGRHYFTVEVANASSLNVEFWAGVNGNRPVQIPPDTMGYEGQIYIAFSALELQLGVDYFFQINVSTDSAGGSEYCIGNCLQLGAGCSDYLVTGFPMGCYIYSWREDNFLQNFSSGGSWAEDMAGGGGGGGVTPPPGPPPSQIPDWAKTFSSMSEIDITQHLTKKHDGQPTPGRHTVTVIPGDGTAHIDVHVRVEENQPGSE